MGAEGRSSSAKSWDRGADPPPSQGSVRGPPLGRYLVDADRTWIRGGTGCLDVASAATGGGNQCLCTPRILACSIGSSVLSITAPFNLGERLTLGTVRVVHGPPFRVVTDIRKAWLTPVPDSRTPRLRQVPGARWQPTAWPGTTPVSRAPSQQAQDDSAGGASRTSIDHGCRASAHRTTPVRPCITSRSGRSGASPCMVNMARAATGSSRVAESESRRPTREDRLGPGQCGPQNVLAVEGLQLGRYFGLDQPLADRPLRRL